MKKKILIGIGSIIIIYLFLSIIFPTYIGVPFAAYQSKNAWIEHEQKINLETKSNSISKFPKPIGIINDYGQVFTESQNVELTKILYEYDIETTRQIIVVTIDSISPYKDIQKYASDLGNEWGVGSAEKDNGLVILLCNPLRDIGISTGYGTELVLTDEICKTIIENVMIPEFKNGDYYNGIKFGVTELIKKWK